MLRRHSFKMILPLVLVFILIAVACGDDDEDEEPTPAAPAAAPTAAAPAAPAPTAAPAPQTRKPMQWGQPPDLTINADAEYTATIVMEKGGEIVIDLFARDAPNTVNSFVFLARQGYYDGVTFHRVIPGFMAQAGDPTGTGGGGPGYSFDDEPTVQRRHDGPGVLSMANRGIAGGRGTNGSQFFITYVAVPNLDGFNPDGSPKNCASRSVSCHTVFGRVIGGMDVVDGITPRDPSAAATPGDVIKTIQIDGPP